MTFNPNPGERPVHPDTEVRVRFRNGDISKHTYRPDQLNWANRNWDFDIAFWKEEN